MGAAEEIADFAALLRELKQRSGLSYEALAKRAHMSTSTLHRYCKGDGVPADNAAVSRFGRVCKATPEELAELHRRWALADAARERARRPATDARADTGDRPTAPTSAPPPTPEPESGSGAEPGSEPASAQEPRDTPPAAPAPAPADAPETPPRARPDRTAPARRTSPLTRITTRKRWALIAASTVVVVAAVSTVLTVDLKTARTEMADTVRPTGAAASAGRSPSAAATRRPSASASPSTRPSRSPAPTPSKSDDTTPSAPATDTSAPGTGENPARHTTAVPLTVSTRTYAWEDPQCEGKYLVDRPPARVSPPVMGQDVPGWVQAQDAIAADAQRVALTVQGTGDDTVVIESLHVRVVDSGTPPAWNAYLGSSGCGGGVETRSFATDLDAAHPAVVPRAGQRDVPYKVSRSDPEVLYITAHADTHDVRWYVELLWSSGGRQGTIRIDDHGRPFRTSGSGGRPVYEYPVVGPASYRVTGG